MLLDGCVFYAGKLITLSLLSAFSIMAFILSAAFFCISSVMCIILTNELNDAVCLGNGSCNLISFFIHKEEKYDNT